jgi:hypothetical protein
MAKWWQFWDPNKKGGKGKAAKPTGGKAGSGSVPPAPSGNNAKKTVVPPKRRGFDGRVR